MLMTEPAPAKAGDAQPVPAASARPPAVHVPVPDDAATPRSRSRPGALLAAAASLLPHLEAGRVLDAAALRHAMTAAFGASDAQGAWVWKDAYEAAEAAMALFLRRWGRAMRREAGSPQAMLAMIETLAALEPSQTRRSQEQVALQQFSTPLPLAYAALRAAAVRSGDTVLEPSAGTGMLAVMAECALGSEAEGRLHLNEIAETRAGILEGLFPGAPVTRHNAEAIADFLPGLHPSVVLMNPPFSTTPGVDKRRAGTDLRHLRSAFAMLPPGGRLVAITSRNCVPDRKPAPANAGDAAWTDAFRRLDPPARVVFSVAIDGRAYARRGTTFDTRLTVIDRDPEGRADVPLDPSACIPDAAALFDAVVAGVPPRLPLEPAPARDLFEHADAAPQPTARKRRIPEPKPAPASARDWGPVAELEYEAASGEDTDDAAPDAGPYEPWRSRTVRIHGAHAHPTSLVQSAAMAAVPHPAPSYRPMLPARVVAEGLLSDAQLESVVLAGQAHDRRLAARYRIGEEWETVLRVDGDDENTGAGAGETADAETPGGETLDGEALSDPVRFRAGWMLGDGTGAGKGRQVAGIILDHWLRGRRRALWLSQSDKLLEDARRDWAAIGGRDHDVFPIAKFRQGADITLSQGILFATQNISCGSPLRPTCARPRRSTLTFYFILYFPISITLFMLAFSPDMRFNAPGLAFIRFRNAYGKTGAGRRGDGETARAMAKLQYRNISKRTVDGLAVDGKDAVFWDRDLPGFGVRVYPSGAKVYVVQSRARGKSRRVAVGRHGVVSAEQARRQARLIIARIKAGENPSPAPPAPEVTVADAVERYLREHAAVRCKPRTAADYRYIAEKHILPELGAVTLGTVGREHVSALHYRLRETPYMANRVVAVLGRIFGLAEAWGLRPDGGNPCRFIRKYKETGRERFLSEEEFRRLGRVLDEAGTAGGVSPHAAAAIRLLLLTGCRKSEVLTLRWEDVDLEAGELRLRDGKTGPRAVPLSPPAAAMLSDLPRLPGNPWVIAGRKPGARMVNLLTPWRVLRARAGLDDVRIHDLRHSYASRALALGESLPMIGRLLGHRQVRSTARYAHLARETVKASAFKVAGSIGADILSAGSRPDPAGAADDHRARG